MKILKIEVEIVLEYFSNIINFQLIKKIYLNLKKHKLKIVIFLIIIFELCLRKYTIKLEKILRKITHIYFYTFHGF
jgi:hypothetical protein